MCGCWRERRSSAGMTPMFSARSNGCRSMSPLPDPHRPVERLWRIVTKARHPGHRRGRTTACVRRQRHPRRDDGRRDAQPISTATASRPASAPAIFTTNDAGYAAAADLEAAASRSRPSSTAARQRTTAWSGRAPVIAGAVVAGRHGAARRWPRSPYERRAAASASPVDALAMSGGFSPIIHLACHRGAQAGLVGPNSGLSGSRTAWKD